MPQDPQKAASHEADERLALAERAAGGDMEALLAVVDRFPISTKGPDGQDDAARQALQRELVRLLSITFLAKAKSRPLATLDEELPAMRESFRRRAARRN